MSDPDVTEAEQTGAVHSTEADTQVQTRERIRQQESHEEEMERVREVGASSESLQPMHGGGGRPRRLLLIGLSGASADLALGAWRGELRTLDLLAERGAWCQLQASQPWASPPAWASLLSGLDAGQLGIYGPNRRTNRSYAPPTPIDSLALRDMRLWDTLGVAGKHVGVVGVPATTPAQPVHGHLIGDQPLASGRSSTFPAALAQQADTWLGEAILSNDPSEAGPEHIDQIIQRAYTRAEQRFLLARRLLARDSYDCFVVVDDGIAAVQHALWDSIDPAHPRYSPQHPFAGTIGSFYRFVDDQLFELLELVDDDTIIAVVSTSSPITLRGEIAINQWLIAEGLLAVSAQPDAPAQLSPDAIIWEQTRAWADAGGLIYMNVAGREPGGIIPAGEAEATRRALAEQLRTLTLADGTPALDVHRPDKIYAAAQGVAPDLILASRQPGWRISTSVGAEASWLRQAGAQSEAAHDAPFGFLIVYNPHSLGGGNQLDPASIYDVAPTLLKLLGQTVPARMRGTPIDGL